MINRIYVLSHKEAVEFSSHELGIDPCAMIRITSGNFQTLKHERNFKHIKCFHFDDSDKDGTPPRMVEGLGDPNKKVILFDEVLAGELRAFVDKVKDECTSLVVHCDGGISRSSAVALATARYLGLEGIAKMIENNSGSWGRYHPNILVLDFLCKEYGLEKPNADV